MRPTTEDALLVDHAARSHGLDRAVVAAVVEQESSWNERAYRYESHLGEASLGWMQTLLSTARQVNYLGTPEGLYDPATSLEYGCRYLVWLRDSFGFPDLEHVLGAYNAGPTAVQRHGWQIVRGYVESVRGRAERLRPFLATLLGEAPGMTNLHVPHNGDWLVTQWYGERPDVYAQFGLRGHNGVDLGVWTGTQLRAIQAGVIAEVAFDSSGYGLYVKQIVDDPLWPEDKDRQWLWAHGLVDDAGWQTFVIVGQRVNAGDLLMLSDNSGFSSGPHLHLATRDPVHDRGDGMLGYADPRPVLERLAAGPAVVPTPVAGDKPPPPWDGLWDELWRQHAALEQEVAALKATVAERDQKIAGLHRDVADVQAAAEYNFSLKMAMEAYLRYLEDKNRVKDGTTDGIIASVPQTQ